MKKRIISIALIVAMVVAMIPAAALSVLAAPNTGFMDGYDAYYAKKAPELDGVMDDAYLNSEAVRPGYHTGLNFTAYYVLADDGIYLCADVKDTTINEGEKDDQYPETSGDWLRAYFQISYTSNGTTTWASQQYIYYDYAHTTGTIGYGESASTITDDGYILEIFVPWSLYKIGTEDVTVYVGIQLNVK